MVIKRGLQLLFILLLTQWIPLFAQGVTPDFLTQDGSGGYTIKQDSLVTFLLKGIRIHMDENMLKYNLIRLSRFSKGNGLSLYEPLELYAWRMNNNTDKVKTDMMGWVFAGGVAGQAAKIARRMLGRYHIRSIYPNLAGIHMKYPVPLWSSRFSASLYPTGTSVTLSDRNNLLSVRYYRTPYSDTFDAGVRLLENNMFSISRIKYKDVFLNRVGISHYHRNFYFRMNYTMHFKKTQYNRFEFVLSWILGSQ